MDIAIKQTSASNPDFRHLAFPSLEEVTRTAVTTEEAAYYLSRRPQTLRGWACHEDGPIRPLRIKGRLAWPVAELRKLLGVA